MITNRASMLLRIKDLEQENGQLRREFENSDLYGSLPGDEISESEVGLLFQELFSPQSYSWFTRYDACFPYIFSFQFKLSQNIIL